MKRGARIGSERLGAAGYGLLAAVLRRAAGATSRDDVTVGGRRVPLLEAGEGPPVMLLHGFGSTKETWLPLAALLSRHYWLLIPDLPGFGASAPIPDELGTAAALAAHVAALQDALALPSAHLVGHSMGGGIALRLARDEPERVRSMALLGAAGPTKGPSDLQRALDRGENPLLPRSYAEYDALLGYVMHRSPPIPRPLRRYLAALQLAMVPRWERIILHWLERRGPDAVPMDLENIRPPALVIQGARDRVIHPDIGRDLAARLPDVRYLELADLGHTPQIEAPLRIARALRAFLDSVA